MNLIAEALRYGPQLLPCKVATDTANVSAAIKPVSPGWQSIALTPELLSLVNEKNANKN